MRSRIINTFFLLLAIHFVGHSQTTLKVEDAISYALENSSVLENAKLDIEHGKQVISETRASALPQVSINSSVTGNPIVQQFVLPAEAFGGAPGEFMAIKAGQDWNAMTQVQLSQQVFNKQLFTGIKAAKDGVEYYQLLKELSEQNVIQQVAINYYMVIINREKLAVIESNMERIVQLEEIIKNQYELGLAKKIDLDRITVNKNNQEAKRVDLRRAVYQQENLLKYYMGMPIQEKINLPVFSLQKLEEAMSLTQAKESYNVEQLLDYQVLSKQKKLMELERDAYKAEYYPSLFLDANYAYNTQSDKFNMYSPNALNYDMSSISLRLSIPVFDGFAKRSRVKQSKIALQKISEEIKDTNNALRMNNENAKEQYESAMANIVSQKANMNLAMDVFNNTQNNYSNGLANLTDLLNAESELVVAQNSYSEALINYKIAEIDLIKSKGQIKTLLNK